MRLATIASALAIIVCVALVGVILSQRTSVAVPASGPIVAVTPKGPPGPVIREVSEPPARVAAVPVTPTAPAVIPQQNLAQQDLTQNQNIAQAAPPRPTAPPAPAAAPPPPPPQAAVPASALCPGNPNALGLS